MAYDHTSIGSGDWDAGGTWDSGSEPAAGESVYIDDGDTVRIDSGTGNGTCARLDQHADGVLIIDTEATSDVSLIMDYGGGGSTYQMTAAGTLQMIGDSDYTAKLIQTTTGQTFDLILNGTIDLDYAEISGLFLKNNRIDIQSGTLDFNNVNIIPYNKTRWYFYQAAPLTSFVTTAVDFQEMYWALQNAAYPAFYFKEGPRTSPPWNKPVVSANNPALGRTSSRVKVWSTMAEQMSFSGAYTSDANKFEIDILEAMRNSLAAFALFTPRKVIDSVYITALEVGPNDRYPTVNDYYVEVTEAD